MVSVFFWAAFGALVGLVAAILQDEQGMRRIAPYILCGAFGGLAGGFMGLRLEPTAQPSRAGSTVLMFAVFGAITFVALAGFARKRPDQ
jgi:uncharacterized membrane protein YeaQ/YmgE (transglycosylase-associated protein family)